MVRRISSLARRRGRYGYPSHGGGGSSFSVPVYRWKAEAFAALADNAAIASWPEDGGSGVDLGVAISNPLYYKTDATCFARFGWNLPFGRPGAAWGNAWFQASNAIFNGAFAVFWAGRHYFGHSGDGEVVGLFGNFDSPTGTGWRFEAVSGVYYVFASNGTYSYQLNCGAVPAGAHTVGIAYDGTTLTVYVNGAQAAQDVNGVNPGQLGLAYMNSQAAVPKFALMEAIGAGGDLGVVNECHYFDGAMSPADVTAENAYFAGKFV